MAYLHTAGDPDNTNGVLFRPQYGSIMLRSISDGNTPVSVELDGANGNILLVASKTCVGSVLTLGQIGNPDTGFSRTTQHTVALGNGTQGNDSGNLLLATLVFGGATLRSGSGDPNSNVSGSVGDLYTDQSGGTSTTLYVKESGSGTDTGWVAK